MPWPKDHKSRTRDRIVQAASAAFRARGLSEVRVEDVCAGAGLTHGGFYAHFSSKDDLLGAALEHASGQTIELLSKALESIPPERRLHAMIDAYLSPEHAVHPERGCPVAALGPEVARVSGRRRRDLAHAVRQRLDWMRGFFPTRRRDELREEQAIGTLACMVGGLVMARLVGGKESAALLEACRDFLHRTLREAPG
ncbi:MAG: TetR family transcriptional regulator [Luteitalea sp.]|nr:TetR family transcriptional regulator [Luteitalea sp.]